MSDQEANPVNPMMASRDLAEAGIPCKEGKLLKGMVALPQPPLVVAFDVVETLFPLKPLGKRLRRVGQSPDLLGLWFAELLRTAFALTASGDYRPFAEVAEHALRAVAGGTLSEDSAREVVAGFATLDPHPEVEETMRLVSEADVRIIVLTNGSAATTTGLLQRSGLHHYVEQAVSVEEVRRWKPAPEPYRHAAAACGVPPDRMALVAAHAWDVHGAHRSGLLTGWVSRLENQWNDLFTPPDVAGPDLLTVVRKLLALREHRRTG